MWAVGWSGAIRHYNGSTWSNLSGGTGEILFGVWAVNPSTVWIVGNGGTALIGP